ncbi:MAG TPA: GNVR domain-containing protein [Pirellulales bacterium]|nr:GNVR domain-containing protein [Pirellulales bacterium]
MPAKPQVSLRDAYRTLFRHRRKMAAWFVTAVAAAVLITLFGPQAYRSEARLLVRLGRENVVLDPTATMGQAPAVAVPLNRENEINSEIVILESRVLLDKVVDALGPPAILEEDDHLTGNAASIGGPVQTSASWLPGWLPHGNAGITLTPRDLAIHKLQKMVEIQAVKKTDVIQVSCDTASPALSQKIVAKLVEFYLEQHLRMNRTAGTHDFFAEQTERLRSDLTRGEEQMRDLKNETGLASPDDQRKIIVERVGRLEESWLLASADVAAAKAQIELLRQGFAAQEETQVTAHTVGFANDAADGMQQQLYGLQLKYQELLAKYTDDHPAVTQVRKQLDQAQSILDREDRARSQVTTGPNRAFEETKLSLLSQEPVLASLEAKAATLEAQLRQSRSDLAEFNAGDVRIARLKRDLDLQDQSYRRYSENFEQSRIDRALEVGRISNVNVLQPATYQPKPVRPRKLLNLALGLLIGAFGAAGLALAAEGLDHSFQNPEDVEGRLELMTLASIPRLKAAHFAVHRRN